MCKPSSLIDGLIENARINVFNPSTINTLSFNLVTDLCSKKEPLLIDSVKKDQYAACHHSDKMYA